MTSDQRIARDSDRSPSQQKTVLGKTVLVTDGDQRAALAVVRSLGAAGYVVHVCASKPKSIGGGSKYATSERIVADPLTDPDQFVADVYEYATAIHASALIPISEASLLAILPRRQQFSGVLIPFTDVDTFRRVSDKAAVLQTARQVGIATPTQQSIDTPAEAERLEFEALSYPIVVKPARSVSGTEQARAKFTVQHAANAQELREIVQHADAHAFPLLLQQRIVGPGIGIFVLLWEGELVAAFSHRRLREHPPAGGVSVYRESVPLDQTLLEQSCALLAAFGWNGVAMIEYKVNQATGTPYLMEINGRFWGSLQLAIDAGVDFPLLLLQAAGGEHPLSVTTYNPETRSRWEWGEMNHLVTRLRHSDHALALPPGSPSRWETMRALLTFDRRDRAEIFRANDIRPFWRESVQWVRDVIGR